MGIIDFLELVMAPISYTDDVGVSLLCGMYHMFEHSLQKIFAYGPPKWRITKSKVLVLPKYPSVYVS